MLDTQPRYLNHFMQSGLILCLLVFFIVFGIFSVQGKTNTYDEDQHYLYGSNIMAGNSTRFDDSKMPLSALNALPKTIASYLPSGGLKDLLNQFLVARFMTILFSSAVALLVYHWSRSMYGNIAALFSLTFYVLDPNIIAHSQLVTTDIYATGTITLAFYTLWRFANDRNLLNGMLCAFALGLSQIAKYTAVVLFPLFFLCIVIYDLAPFLCYSDKLGALAIKFKKRILQYVWYSAFCVIVVLLTINVGFLFQKTFTPFGNYEFRSKLFQNIQHTFPILNDLPVPVPYPYLEGLDWVFEREQTGAGYGSIYLLGHIRHGQGFSGYYIVAWLLKEPIATQIFVIAALGIFIINQNSRRKFRANELFLFVPIIFYTVYFNFFYNAQIGIRYYLIVFPFLFILSGHLFTDWQKIPTCYKTYSLGLIIYLLVSVLSYYPYYLTYFNELVWNRTHAYKYLADSNIDWGQSRNEFNQYLMDNPDVVYPTKNVRAGKFIVNVNDLVGISKDESVYKWLRENFEPSGTVANAYLIYDVTPKDKTNLCSKTSYCK